MSWSSSPGFRVSSLAFDTLYAEGQRRYVEPRPMPASFGRDAKARCRSDRGSKPGDQHRSEGQPQPRSTVGTVTEIYDYLRLLYARIGTPTAPSCGREGTNRRSARS